MRNVMSILVMAMAAAALVAWTAAGTPATDNQRGKTMSEQANQSRPSKMPPLNEQERRVIIQKGTEPPFSGKYHDNHERGVYVCRQCGALLYLSESKFDSHCGWPSFDDEIRGAVKRQRDADGQRTEIMCAACGGHLGHVFTGEGQTAKDTRHCVNSLSLAFIPQKDWPVQRAIFAGGCFWGVEHAFTGLSGVLRVTSGYTGGKTDNPTYRDVCTGKTGHAETVEVLFDPAKVSYEALAKLFLEIHDPTQLNRQGPDYGSQYRSAIFYTDDQQKAVAAKLLEELRQNGYDVVTQLQPAGTFWQAEEYHQDYLAKHPERQSCHVRVARFATTAKANAK